MFAARQFRSAFLNLLWLTSLSAAQAALQDTALPTYRTSVSEVRVTFFATDENGQPVTDLTSSDLAVVDSEQVLRTFRSFRRSNETALDVVVVLDASQSVGPRFQFAMTEVAQIVAHEQSIPEDNVSIISFGDESPAGNRTPGTPAASLHPVALCASGCRTSYSASNLQALESGTVTPLFDALVFGVEFISHHRRPGARQILILFSDGNDTISLHSSRDALQAVTEAGALVYSVDMGNLGQPTRGCLFLQQLSRTSGGRYLFMGSARKKSASDILETVLGDLRASYVVTYALPNHLAGFHDVRLLPTRNLNLTFHSRNGYYYETSPH